MDLRKILKMQCYNWQKKLQVQIAHWSNISKNTDVASVSQVGFAQSQKTVIQGVTKFRAALTSVGSVIKSVGASMLNMGIAMAASWAVGKIIEGLIDLAHYDENIIKAGQEAKESIDNTFNSFEEGAAEGNRSCHKICRIYRSDQNNWRCY